MAPATKIKSKKKTTFDDFRSSVTAIARHSKTEGNTARGLSEDSKRVLQRMVETMATQLKNGSAFTAAHFGKTMVSDKDVYSWAIGRFSSGNIVSEAIAFSREKLTENEAFEKERRATTAYTDGGGGKGESAGDVVPPLLLAAAEEEKESRPGTLPL